MIKVQVNVNDMAWIKVNAIGEAHLRKIGYWRIYELKQRDEDGRTKWQLWEMANTFGSIMNIGLDAPFETTITIEVES